VNVGRIIVNLYFTNVSVAVSLTSQILLKNAKQTLDLELEISAYFIKLGSEKNWQIFLCEASVAVKKVFTGIKTGPSIYTAPE
jgi:hypothetical protein